MDNKSFLNLVAFDLSHKHIVNNWANYNDEFKELDYALRDGGWIDEYFNKKETHIFAAVLNNELIGFTILSDDEYGTEFRIALSPQHLGFGFGKLIAQRTFEKGFQELEKQSIYLIVRVDNIRAIALYKKFNFRVVCEVQKKVNHKMVRFIKMEKLNHEWQNTSLL
ncbi:MAG: GNAT family N-acetyltransferase [Arcobacteraceae bacterium]|jgi:RimJ/RimL family protein N-acetyltransferase|nr:GNAT family N-acetyltransferase [Arcobacteraceae bacterium]